MEESTCLLFDLRGSQCSNGVFTCPHGCAPRDYGIPMTVPLPDPCGPLTGPNMCAVATKYAWDRDLDVFVRNLLIEIIDFGPRAVCGPFTEICPLGSGCKEPLLFGEIFSGGFSGWSRGTSFLSTLGLPGRTCFSFVLFMSESTFRSMCMDSRRLLGVICTRTSRVWHVCRNPLRSCGCAFKVFQFGYARRRAHRLRRLASGVRRGGVTGMHGLLSSSLVR